MNKKKFNEEFYYNILFKKNIKYKQLVMSSNLPKCICFIIQYDDINNIIHDKYEINNEGDSLIDSLNFLII